MRAITALGLTMNLEVASDQARAVAEVLAESGWVPDEIDQARRDILADPELMQVIRYAGAVTPEVFVRYRALHPRPASRTCSFCCVEIEGWDVVTVDGRVYHGECFSGRVPA
jgi:hypothetical protein